MTDDNALITKETFHLQHLVKTMIRLKGFAAAANNYSFNSILYSKYDKDLNKDLGNLDGNSNDVIRGC